MNLTERDICVVDFINTYKAATTKMLVDSHYNNYNVGTRRLKMLVDEGYLKRSRIATGEWLYHTGSNTLIKNLTITKFILDLKAKGVTIGDVYYDKKLKGMDVGAQVKVNYDGKNYLLLVDFEIVGTFNKSKYDSLLSDDIKIDGYTPIVVVIDNKPIDTDTNYSIVKINRCMDNIDSLLSVLEKGC